MTTPEISPEVNPYQNEQMTLAEELQRELEALDRRREWILKLLKFYE